MALMHDASRQTATDSRRQRETQRSEQPQRHAPHEHALLLQRWAGNRAVAGRLATTANPSTATLAREKKVKDNTESNIAAGELVPSMQDVVSKRVADPSYRDAGFRGHQADIFAVKLDALLHDDAQVKAVVDEITHGANAFWGKTKTPEKAAEWIPSDPEISEVVSKLIGILARAATPDEKSQPWIDAQATQEFGQAGTRVALAKKLSSTAVTGLDASASQRRRAELLDRPEGSEFSKKLSSKDRKDWAKALRKLPAMVDLAAMHKHKKATAPLQGGRAKDAKWKNNKGMVEDAVKLDEDGKNPVKLPTGHKMAKRIEDADAILRRIVEDTVLGELPPPQVNVHHQDVDHFRAFQSGGTVHVARDEPTPIVVHETGHYIEEKGPLESWVDIQRLMHARHEEAGGGAAVKGPAGKAEGRYKGEYPATGRYTSSTYKAGATEVMSMTVEYLANPNKFSKLIDGDPLQAAIVLRALAPAAYAAEGDLRAFDRHLPS